MAWFWDNNTEENEDRGHQDNFLVSYWDGEKNNNSSYQYCSYCGKNQPFEWDRCSECHNN